jgi:hypothetical protein
MKQTDFPLEKYNYPNFTKSSAYQTNFNDPIIKHLQIGVIILIINTPD